jgi:methylated-DNA-[protein]-cysteine S-methyltransferase
VSEGVAPLAESGGPGSLAGVTTRARLQTSLGDVGVEATDEGLARVRLPGARLSAEPAGGAGRSSEHAARAAAQLGEYLAGEREEFELELDWSAVDAVHRRVLETLSEAARYGETITYGELGRRSGVDDAQEIGVLMSRNPLPLVVPCHRVVAADGLGGYGGGLELKQRLLELEGVLPPRLDLGVD